MSDLSPAALWVKDRNREFAEAHAIKLANAALVQDALRKAYHALYALSEADSRYEEAYWNEGGGGYAAFTAVSDAIEATR